MRVHRVQESSAHEATVELLDDDGQPIPAVASFLRYLRTRGCSPNTLSAYAYDLLHFMLFLKEQQLTYQEFTPPHAFQFLEYLSTIPSRKQARRLGLVLSTTTTGGTSATRLSPATINRTFAAVSSFYEYLILSGAFTGRENPLQQQVDDQALARVAERHRPFMGRASRQRPIRRSVHVKTVRRVPRPLDDEQICKLLTSLARRRVILRYRTDHPKGARTKSRTERVVDFLQAETLQAVSDYVMHERPSEATSPYVFLVGGRGKRRAEPLSYAALVKLCERHCERLGLRTPWITPHALRHTHATRMFEGGMRDLTLQKRLGHASPESTRIYTDVSDATVVAEYRQALQAGEERQ